MNNLEVPPSKYHYLYSSVSKGVKTETVDKISNISVQCTFMTAFSYSPTILNVPNCFKVHLYRNVDMIQLLYIFMIFLRTLSTTHLK